MVELAVRNQPSSRLSRLVLLFGCLAGILTYVVTSIERPDQLMLASDVYRHTAQAWLAGDGLYHIHPPDRPGYSFLYPPIAVIAFLPHAVLPSDLAGFLLQTVLNLLAAFGTAAVIYRGLDRRDVDVDRIDFGLLAGFMVLSSYSAIQFMNGQVNLWLAFAIAIGFDAIDRDRHRVAGIAFALAALVKVFPAVIGLWLLRIRAVGAVAAVFATGVGGLVLGAVLFGPDLTLTYLFDVLIGRYEGSTYVEPPSPDDNVDGIHRQLAALWPAGAAYHTFLAIAIVGPLAALTQVEVETRFDRDVAGLGIIVSVLLFLPLQPLYFPLIVFPLFMVLYTIRRGVERLTLLVGTVLTLLSLDQQSILLALDVLRLPGWFAAEISQLTETIFTVVLPPTLGLWLMLFACVLLQFPDLGFDQQRNAPAPA